MNKPFCWGDTFLAVLDTFTAPEIKRLARHCRKLIKEFEHPGSAANEGYSCSRMAFEMFECGFLLTFDDRGDAWVLHIVSIPENRRRRRARGARGAAPASGPRRPKRTLKRLVKVVHRIIRRTQFGQAIAVFMADARMMGVLASDYLQLRRGEQDDASSLPSEVIGLFRRLAAPLAQDMKALAELEPRMFGQLAGLPMVLCTYGAALQHTDVVVIWDASLFGALPDGPDRRST